MERRCIVCGQLPTSGYTYPHNMDEATRWQTMLNFFVPVETLRHYCCVCKKHINHSSQVQQCQQQGQQQQQQTGVHRCANKSCGHLNDQRLSVSFKESDAILYFGDNEIQASNCSNPQEQLQKKSGCLRFTGSAQESSQKPQVNHRVNYIDTALLNPRPSLETKTPSGSSTTIYMGNNEEEHPLGIRRTSGYETTSDSQFTNYEFCFCGSSSAEDEVQQENQGRRINNPSSFYPSCFCGSSCEVSDSVSNSMQLGNENNTKSTRVPINISNKLQCCHSSCRAFDQGNNRMTQRKRELNQPKFPTRKLPSSQLSNSSSCQPLIDMAKSVQQKKQPKTGRGQVKKSYSAVQSLNSSSMQSDSSGIPLKFSSKRLELEQQQRELQEQCELLRQCKLQQQRELQQQCELLKQCELLQQQRQQQQKQQQQQHQKEQHQKQQQQKQQQQKQQQQPQQQQQQNQQQKQQQQQQPQQQQQQNQQQKQQQRPQQQQQQKQQHNQQCQCCLTPSSCDQEMKCSPEASSRTPTSKASPSDWCFCNLSSNLTLSNNATKNEDNPECGLCSRPAPVNVLIMGGSMLPTYCNQMNLCGQPSHVSEICVLESDFSRERAVFPDIDEPKYSICRSADEPQNGATNGQEEDPTEVLLLGLDQAENGTCPSNKDPATKTAAVKHDSTATSPSQSPATQDQKIRIDELAKLLAQQLQLQQSIQVKLDELQGKSNATRISGKPRVNAGTSSKPGNLLPNRTPFNPALRIRSTMASSKTK